MSAQPLYRIEARSYPLLFRKVSHNYLALRSPNGKVISELHGLATNNNGEFVPIGIRGDKLRFYEFKADNSRAGSYFQEQQKSKILYRGSLEEVSERWDVPVSQLSLLNSKDIDYSPFGVIELPTVNSNSAYRLLSELMEFSVYKFNLLSSLFEVGITTDLKKMYYDETLHTFGELV